MNNNIVENRWKNTRKELNKFRNEYLKLNKNTQDKIQDLFNSLNITYQDLSKIISKRDQDRLERKIDSWKQKKIFKGYFKYRVEELMKGQINYRNLIEILLYGIEIEEQEENKDSIYNLFINCSLDCYNQGRKDLKKKEKSILPQVLLTTFLMTAVNGTMWKDYIDAYYLTNMQEIQKRYLISLQQGKIPDIYDDTWQRTFEIQQNRLIDINNTKYSGGIDKYVTTYGNLAYLEASDNDNQQVKFVSDLCDNVTEMCSYMDGMIFNTKNRNVFKRPIGKTVKDLTLQTIDVIGLVLGINLPPIEEHFHWCHSVLTYITDKSTDELREEIFIKNGLSANNKYTKEKHKPPILLEEIDITNEQNIYNTLEKYEKVIKNDIIENAIVITEEGKVYQCFGNETNVWPDIDLGEKLLNSYVTHNHPKKETNYSFSEADIRLFEKFNLSKLRGVDDKYIYEFDRNKQNILKNPTFDDNELGFEHIKSIQYAIDHNIFYKRWEND